MIATLNTTVFVVDIKNSILIQFAFLNQSSKPSTNGRRKWIDISVYHKLLHNRGRRWRQNTEPLEPKLGSLNKTSPTMMIKRRNLSHNSPTSISIIIYFITIIHPENCLSNLNQRLITSTKSTVHANKKSRNSYFIFIPLTWQVQMENHQNLAQEMKKVNMVETWLLVGAIISLNHFYYKQQFFNLLVVMFFSLL